MHDGDLTEAALKTYLYGYPLVYDLMETQRLIDGTSPLLPGTQANRFGAARELLGPDATFVGPNDDTCYLKARCDLRDANWLPAPAGKFRPILRSYQPLGPMLTGGYVLPKVRKLADPR